MTKNKQQLSGSNRSVNIGEALAARVKDPLWFLARQWQTGEFEAENGGRLADISMSSRHFPVAKLRQGNEQTQIDRHVPLEALVEAEAEDGRASAWAAEALEYRFGLETTAHRFEAEDYNGFAIDWYLFDFAESLSSAEAVKDKDRSYVPTHLQIKGAPDPRWWVMEDAEAYFDSPEETEPTVLSTLLPEFFYTDINNWYVIPAEMPAGSVRQIDRLRATDSFGVVTELKPVEQGDWALFSIDPLKEGGAGLPASALFAPNVALDILHNDVLEDVRFLRDEQANLVWAHEQCVTSDDGEKLRSGERPDQGLASGDRTPGYKFMTAVAESWIPYVPRQIDPSASNGEMYLRRARTNPDADAQSPQYRSQILAESTRLYEEEIPKSGLRVRRIAKFAHGSDQKDHFWIGRHKDAGRSASGPGLRFDYLVEGEDST